MAQTTDHVVRIRADAAGLKRAGDEIEKAFKGKSVDELKRKVREAERALVALTDKQDKLNQALKKTDKGSDAYKKIVQELKEAERELRTTEAAVNRLNRALKGADDDAKRRQLTAQTSGFRAFGAGLLQGSGLMQYLPSGQGMGWRIAGGIAGMAARSIAGAGRAVAAPFLTPGIGGLSQMLGSIPIVGGMAAGALSAGQGYYHQAVALDQARLRNLYMAPGSLGRFHSTATKDDYQRMQSASETLLHAEGGQGPRAQRAREREREALAREAKRRHATGAAVIEMDAQIQRLQFGGGRTVGAFGALTGQRTAARLGESSGLANTRAWIERGLAEDRAEAKRLLEDAQRRTKRGYREGTMGDEMSIGVPFGLDPQAVQAAKASYFGARGGYSRRPEVMGEFRAALAAQTLYGISPEMAGTFQRHTRESGSAVGSDRGEALAHVMAMAVAQGLEGSLAVEYLGTIVEFQKKAATQGVKFDAREFTRSSSIMQAMGITGPQGTRVTAGIQEAAVNMGRTGVSSPMQMLMLRAMGYDPSQGAAGYAKQMLRISRGQFDAASMQKFIGSLSAGTGDNGDVSTLHFMRAMGGMGVNVGADQAEKIMGAFRGGKLSDDVLAQAGLIEQKALARGGRAGQVEGGARLAGKGAGLAVTAAGMSAEQTGLGASMAGTFINLERATHGSVRALKEFNGALESIAKAQVAFMALAVESLQAVGAGAKAKGLVDKILGMVGFDPNAKPPGHKR